MSGPEQLYQYEDHWPTAMGAFLSVEGRVVFRGKDLLHDMQDLPWAGLLWYGITGKMPDAKQIQLLEGIWRICNSYPEPRIWNNRIAALAGTARSTGALAIGAATAVSEASVYGLRNTVLSLDFLYRLQRQLDRGVALYDALMAEKEKYRIIPGYGRPIRNEDERIPPMLELARSLGLAETPYVRLVFAIEDILSRSRWNLRMNIAALLAALAAEQGLSCQEFYLFRVLGYSGGMFPCYIDAADKPEACFFPLRCDRISYEGNPARPWDDPGPLPTPAPPT